MEDFDFPEGLQYHRARDLSPRSSNAPKGYYPSERIGKLSKKTMSSPTNGKKVLRSNLNNQLEGADQEITFMKSARIHGEKQNVQTPIIGNYTSSPVD